MRALILLLVLAALGSFAVLAWHPAIAPLEVAAAPAVTSGEMARGAALAAIGDCAVCHTAPGGAAYAGGRRLPTPFGAVYGSNITPDPETGIGRWSLAAFVRAMRQGVDRGGHQIYPAMPYDHFTRVDDDDLAALYAFIMAVPPVRATPPANELMFPLGWRPLLAAWNWLYLDDRRFRPDPAQDEAWNRGALLVDGLGHCGGCHSPRNSLGAEAGGHALEGGEAEGWRAWPLAGAGWSEASLFAYLRTGFDHEHGAAAGPMQPVAVSLGRVPEADVRAMAHHLATLSGPPRAASPMDMAADPDSPGAAIFAGACNSCHGAASAMHAAGAPFLNTSSAVLADDPGNALRVILGGIRADRLRAGPQMPAYAAMLSDAQAAAVAATVRARYAPGRPAWTGLVDAVHHIRSEGGGR